MKTTAWFSADVKPVHPGVYQRELSWYEGGIRYARWDGVRWYRSAFSVVNAWLANKPTFVSAKWRGLAEEPK